MVLEFTGEIVEWRGPAPFLFVRTPEEVTLQIKEISRQVTYGWGCLPAILTLGKTKVSTALFPREGAYMVPIKVAMQRAEKVGLGDEVALTLEFSV